MRPIERHLARRLLALAMMFTLAMGLLSGCQDDPIESEIERFETLNELLRDHRDGDPEALLEAFESYVDENAEGFTRDREAYEALDEDEKERLKLKHEDRMQEVLNELLNIVVEIQDRLRDRPELLSRFLELMRRLE